MNAARVRAVPVAIAVLAIAVHANVLGHAFVYDDLPQVVENAWIRDLANVPEMFRTHVAGFADDQVANYYRPLMHVVYALTYAAFGLSPRAFHLVSILIHAGCAVLAWSLARRLLAGASDARGVEVGAAVAGALFAVHPVHVEAVVWIAGVPDLTYGLFALASMAAYARFAAGGPRRRTAYAASLAAFAIAPFAKEPALAVPAVLAALEFGGGASLLDRRRWLRLVPFAAVGAAYLVVRYHALGDLAPLPRHPELGTTDCLLNAPVLFSKYLAKLALPVGLNAFHVLHPVRSAADPRALLGLVAAAAFAVAAWRALRRDRATTVALALVAAPLLPVLWIPWVGENTFAERYLYLPSAGFAIAVGRFLAFARPTRAFRAAVATALAAAAAMGVATWHRSAVWADERSLWSDTAARSPDGAIPRSMYGDVLLGDGDVAGAIAEYEASLALDPGNPATLNNLGLALLWSGRTGEALARLEEADRREPGSPQTLNNLGLAYRDAGRLDEAVAAFERALALRPGHPGLLGNLAQVYALQGRDDDARRAADAARDSGGTSQPPPGR